MNKTDFGFFPEVGRENAVKEVSVGRKVGSKLEAVCKGTRSGGVSPRYNKMNFLMARFASEFRERL